MKLQLKTLKNEKKKTREHYKFRFWNPEKKIKNTCSLLFLSPDSLPPCFGRPPLAKLNYRWHSPALVKSSPPQPRLDRWLLVRERSTVCERQCKPGRGSGHQQLASAWRSPVGLPTHQLGPDRAWCTLDKVTSALATPDHASQRTSYTTGHAQSGPIVPLSELICQSWTFADHRRHFRPVTPLFETSNTKSLLPASPSNTQKSNPRSIAPDPIFRSFSLIDKILVLISISSENRDCCLKGEMVISYFKRRKTRSSFSLPSLMRVIIRISFVTSKRTILITK